MRISASSNGNKAHSERDKEPWKTLHAQIDAKKQQNIQKKLHFAWKLAPEVFVLRATISSGLNEGGYGWGGRTRSTEPTPHTKRNETRMKHYLHEIPAFRLRMLNMCGLFALAVAIRK